MVSKLIKVWNTETKKYEYRRVKLKGALGTGNILDIIQIILILVIIMGLLEITGLHLTDLFNLIGTAVTQLWNWFLGF